MLQTDYVIGSPLNHQDPFIQRHVSHLTANEPPPFIEPFMSRRGIRLAYFFPGPARGTGKKIVQHSLRSPFLQGGGGWSGDAMMLGKLAVPGRATYMHSSRARALAVGFLWTYYSRLSIISLFFNRPLSGRRPDID